MSHPVTYFDADGNQIEAPEFFTLTDPGPVVELRWNDRVFKLDEPEPGMCRPSITWYNEEKK